MNRIHRSVWCPRRGTHIAVAETSSQRSKAAGTSGVAGALLFTVVLGSVSPAFAAGTAPSPDTLPTGAQVSAGAAQISQSGSAMTITQGSARAAIDWQSFSVGSNARVNFVQPSAQAVALNRVLGSDVSVIQGAINANGRVYLVNPSGITFTTSAQVNVGSLVASTLALDDTQLAQQRQTFSGNSSATILNQGRINVATGSHVALVATRIVNQGRIEAPQGQVLAGAGRRVVLDLGGPVYLNVEEGALSAAIEQSGHIRADGGQVLLTARAAGLLSSAVINHTGLTEARSLAAGEGGRIVLLADMQQGAVNVAGRIDASAPLGVRGGFVETSAARVTVQDGTQVDTRAPSGQAGTWLIDPTDYTIAASGGNISGAALTANLGSGNVTILSSSGSGSGNGDIIVNDSFSASTNNLTLTAARDILFNVPATFTGTASLTLNPATANGADAVVNSGRLRMGFASDGTFAGRIDFSASGALVIGGNTYTVINSLGAATSSTGTDLQGMRGNRAGNYVLGSNIDASTTSTWNAGAGFTPIARLDYGEYFTGRFDGLGHTISGLRLNRPSDMYQSLLGGTNNATRVAISNIGLSSISVTGLASTGGLIGSLYGDVWNAWVGGNSTITGGANQDIGGLVGGARYNLLSTITDSHVLAGVTVSAASANGVGGLVGGFSVATGSTIQRSYSLATVSGNYYTGGLVGNANVPSGTVNFIENYATGNVSGRDAVGGLVGMGNSTVSIARSYATGNVSSSATANDLGGGSGVGGLVGALWGGSITNSYARGNVATAYRYAGGLVGQNANVTNSYATGLITAPVGAMWVGGLMGISGSVSNSFWDTQTSGISSSNGYGTGRTTAQMQQASTFNSASWVHNPWGFQAGVNGGYPALMAWNPNATWMSVPIYLRLIGGTSQYGNAPALTYALYTAASGGTVVTDANPAGTVSWTGTLPTASTGLGTYSLTYNTGISLGNSAYTLAPGAAASWTIQSRPITVNAINSTKLYGSADPSFGWSITAGSLVGSDTLSGAIARTVGENAGIYALSAVGLTNANYAVTPVGGTLTIQPRPITVSATNSAKFYGDTDPSFGWSITAGSLVGSDTLNGAPTRTPGEIPGTYAISVTGLNHDNYAVTSIDGLLTIHLRPTPTAASVSALPSTAISSARASFSPPARKAEHFFGGVQLVAVPSALVASVGSDTDGSGTDSPVNRNGGGTQRLAAAFHISGSSGMSGPMRIFVVNGGITTPPQASALTSGGVVLQ